MTRQDKLKALNDSIDSLERGDTRDRLIRILRLIRDELADSHPAPAREGETKIPPPEPGEMAVQYLDRTAHLRRSPVALSPAMNTVGGLPCPHCGVYMVAADEGRTWKCLNCCHEKPRMWTAPAPQPEGVAEQGVRYFKELPPFIVKVAYWVGNDHAGIWRHSDGHYEPSRNRVEDFTSDKGWQEIPESEALALVRPAPEKPLHKWGDKVDAPPPSPGAGGSVNPLTGRVEKCSKSCDEDDSCNCCKCDAARAAAPPPASGVEAEAWNWTRARACEDLTAPWTRQDAVDAFAAGATFATAHRQPGGVPEELRRILAHLKAQDDRDDSLPLEYEPLWRLHEYLDAHPEVLASPSPGTGEVTIRRETAEAVRASLVTRMGEPCDCHFCSTVRADPALAPQPAPSGKETKP